MPHLLLLGLSHHTAPIELRERVDFATGALGTALSALAQASEAGEAVVLSTCNRAEIYATCGDPARARQALTQFMGEFHGIETGALSGHLYSLIDADAARHLFRVASGLDSLVVGEPQILGQVKAAYAAASDQQCTGALLNKLFHWSFAVGKRVRTDTGLAEGAVSVSFAAVSLARKIFGDLRGLSVLLLGAGEMGKLTATHLKAQEVRRIAIASRTAAHAEAVAQNLGADAIPWADFPSALISSDIVVTATGAATPILSRAQVVEAMGARRHRPLFIIDIAMPRDVEPLVGELEQVFLYNIDDLQTIVRDNLSRRGAEVARAEAIVTEEVGQFMGWLRSRDAIPTVVALRQRFETIRRAELQRLESKIAGLSPEARARIDEITRLIVEKLLLTPTEQLKSLSDHDTVVAYSDALSRLFSLTPEEAAAIDEQRTASEPAAASTARVDKR